MADALLSAILEQLTSILGSKLSKELKLLKGVEKEIQMLKTDFEAIKEVVDDAEKRSLKEETPVKIWVDQLKDTCYDMEDLLDELRTETVLQHQRRQPTKGASSLQNKVRSFWTSSHLPQFAWNRDIALKIKDINRRLDAVVNDKDRFKFTAGTTANEPERPQTTSFVDVSEIYGRGHVKETLIDRLLGDGSQEEHHHLTITAIVGMGGIGKTTLARLAFNDESVKKRFQKRIWVCASDPFNVTNVAREIIEGLGFRDGIFNLMGLKSLLQAVSKAIENQKFLLVLDDVWNEDKRKWEPLINCLKNGARGSKILVTTRSKRVADLMEAPNPIRLKELSPEECWSIFSRTAFSERSEEECTDLEEIGRKMSERCKGLPLAAKVLGGLMRFKRSRMEWQHVLESDLWESEGGNKDLDSTLMLSYYDLPSPMKRCFTYCAIFPEDHVIEADSLIQLWMANGFLKGKEMEVTGEEYFKSLVMRSFFQDVKRDGSGRIYCCKMHDLVRDFAVRLSRNECGAMEVYKDEEDQMMQEPSYAKLRHARLICKGDHLSSAVSKLSIDGRRTLMITELKVPKVERKVLRGLFCGLTVLRVLELRDTDIQELPVEIGKLMLLRYLRLEDNHSLKALPETVCDLCNLQTLKLSYCSRIEMLPRGIGKLVNLRHLECENMLCLMKLPKAIGELTSLRRLSGLDLSPNENSGDSNQEEYFGIGDLEKLNCLEHLSLYWLGNVKDAGEAKRAGLKKKKNLRHLFLHFKGSSDAAEEEATAKRNLLIAEALEPPPSLEYLWFGYYRGTELPSWITSLSGLKGLSLHSSPNLKELPRGIERLPLHKVSIGNCPALADYCKKKMMENSALASVLDISD